MASRLFRPALVVSAAALLLGLSGCVTTVSDTANLPASIGTRAGQGNANNCTDGVGVVVNYEVLGASDVNECVGVSGATAAKTVLEQAGVALAGTAQYGDAVICRVNNLPSASKSFKLDGADYTESCNTMPSANAYWSLWQRTGTGDWSYAQTGVNDITLNPGDSIGLVFTVDNSTASPAASGK